MKTFLIVAFTILITSLFTAVMIVAGLEYLLEKYDFKKKNQKKEGK